VHQNVPVLSASEIASFAFCRQAWYLGRQNVARSAAGAENLAKGIAAHQHVGARADRLRAIERTRRWLILVLCGLGIALLVQLFNSGGSVLPW
jgi:hypothetical protein